MGADPIRLFCKQLKEKKNVYRGPSNTSSLPTRLRNGGENSGGIEFLNLILDIWLDMRMLSP